MKNIIVTGGLGFIGSNLIGLLLKKKYRVINLDKVTYSSNFYNTKEFIKNKNYKFIKCDINDNKLTNIFFKYKPICIFNLAAETHVDRSIDSPATFIKSNIVGVYNILEHFKISSVLPKLIFRFMISNANALYNLPLYNTGALNFFETFFASVDLPTEAGPSIAIIFAINE